MAFRPHPPRTEIHRRLMAAMGIAASAALLEILGSWWSGSLALLSDAGHVGTDAVAIGLSLLALRVSERPHTPRMSFGYHRMEVLAALANAILLLGIALFLIVQAYGRLVAPPSVESGLMFAVGLAGLGANLAMLVLLRTWAQRNINVRGAFLHAYGDTLGSVGVVSGAILIAFTSIVLLDALVAVLIVGLILFSAARLLRDAVRIVLEASPPELVPEDVAATIRTVEGVRGVHDLHIWTVTSGLHALTGHIAVAGDASVQRAGEIVDAVTALIRERFGIDHVTLQVDSFHEELIPSAEVEGQPRA